MADISVLNTTADISGKTLVTAEGDRTITGLYTFSRGVGAPPFAAVAGSSVVTNLNADKVDGQDAPAGTIVGTSDVQTLTNKTLTSPVVNWTVVTVTDTGNQNNYAPGLVGDTIIRCNNASLLTITGLAGGFSGQRVRFVAVNGQIDFAYSSASSSVGNKFINWVSSGNTSITTGAGSGYAEYVYDATSQVWRLVSHEQGGWITPAFSAGNFTANGSMTWTVGSGDVLTCQYYLRGKTLAFQFTIATTTVGGTVNTQLIMANTQLGGFTWTKQALIPMVYSDASAAAQPGLLQISAGGTSVIFFKAGTVNWTASTDTTAVYGSFVAEVT